MGKLEDHFEELHNNPPPPFNPDYDPMAAVWQKQATDAMEEDGFYDNHTRDECAIELRSRIEKLAGKVRAIIFLDIDGVLNTATHIHEWGINMHPEFVQRVRNICEEYNADIVVSSAWRIGDDHWEATKFMLMNLGIPFLRIRGRTGTEAAKGRQNRRGHQIQAWLDSQGQFRHRPYVIIDDDDDMLDTQRDYFVKTTWEQGLTADKADEVRAVLDAQGVTQTVKEPVLDYFDIYTRKDQT